MEGPELPGIQWLVSQRQHNPEWSWIRDWGDISTQTPVKRINPEPWLFQPDLSVATIQQLKFVDLYQTVELVLLCLSLKEKK